MIALAVSVLASMPAMPAADATASARRIAVATVQPPRALAEALAQFDRQFTTGLAGTRKARTAYEKNRAFRMRAAGRAELSRQLNRDGIPRLTALVERDYARNYSAAELAEIARFWTSPAGPALNRAIQSAGAGGRLVLPPAQADAITAYLSSPAGRKEAARSASLRTAMAQEMTAFFQRAQPRIAAHIAAAGK